MKPKLKKKNLKITFSKIFTYRVIFKNLLWMTYIELKRMDKT